MPRTWTFHSAGQIRFGIGAADQTGEIAARLGLRRVLVITDQGLIDKDIAAPALSSLGAASVGIEVFAGGAPEPSLRLAERCIGEARGYGPDGIIGLGGGSNMDLAKIAALVLTHGGSARDYVGEDRVPGPVLPLICIPTTAGTGSEVSASAIVTDEENEIKLGILSNYLRPRAAIIDPQLTVSCPKKVTADSGIDALTHAIEAYTAVDNEDFPLPEGERSMYQGAHRFGDCVAEKAIATIGANLALAVSQPKNLDARKNMSLGAMLGGLAFSNVGVALVHALEYPVGGATHCSHGAGNGLLLPHVMRFNLPQRMPRFAQIARLLGRDTAGMSQQQAAEEAIVAVESLNRAIGIPARLRDLGTREDQLPAFAEKAFGITRMLRVNPRAATVEDLLGILRAAF